MINFNQSNILDSEEEVKRKDADEDKHSSDSDSESEGPAPGLGGQVGEEDTRESPRDNQGMYSFSARLDDHTS